MSRMVDANGLTVEVTPTGYLVRAANGALVGRHLGDRAPLPRTPDALVDLGVDLASLQEVAA